MGHGMRCPSIPLLWAVDDSTTQVAPVVCVQPPHSQAGVVSSELGHPTGDELGGDALRGSGKRGERGSDGDAKGEGEAGEGERLAGSKKRARRGSWP